MKEFKNGDFSYELVKEDKKNPLRSTYKKKGLTVDFTPEEILGFKDKLEKAIKELKSNEKLQKAKIENVEHFHPSVKSFTPEQLSHFHTYQEAKMAAKEFRAGQVEYKKALRETLAEIEALKSNGVTLE